MDSSSGESRISNGPIHERAQTKRRLARSSVPMMPVALLLSSQHVASARDLALINKNPFLPDYMGNLCKNDKPADSWMTAVPVTAEACCKLNFSWNLPTCEANSKKWALENAPDTVEENEEEVDTSTKYWADTTAGLCKLDGPDRPSWTTAYEIPYQECCDKYLSWSYDKCMAHAPKEDEAEQNSSSEEKKYYPDSIKGYCKEDGPSRPSWATALEDDYTTCCENHFDESEETLYNCMKKMPNSATRKPTGKPTEAPVSSAPTKALYFTPAPEASNPTTSPPTTLRPTPLPTTNVICSDQTLSKSQCESNPKCIWYLKNGIACTYKAWVMPTAKPTPRPTMSPVISYEFYNIPSSGLCAFNDESKPAWITKIYDDWDECCQEESWDVPKCLAAKPAELKQNDMQMNNAPTGGGSGSTDYVIIDITMYGSLMLDKLILPSVTSDEWNDLKRVLTKSLILTLAYDTRLVHPNVEVELWSVGTQQFSWRRLFSEDTEEIESGSTSSLRGAQRERRARKENKTKKPSSQPSSKPVAQNNDMVQNSQSLASKYELKFALVVPTKCDSDCQSSNGYLGQAEADLIEEHLQEFVKNNYFGVQLKREGNAMGLFFDSLPKASGVKLSYQFAAKAAGGLTWTPSASPTLKPTSTPTTSPTITASPSSSSKPISRTYYPDYENHICKVADGSEPEFEINFFPSLKKCCKFEWIDFDTCMQFSFTDRPTPKPTGSPTVKPTKGPKTKRPSPKPTVKTSPAPTMRPIKLNSSPIGIGGVVYYPDLVLGVCKSDGKHGNIPYKFSTAEACCNNNLMDYVKCITYARPKKYYPNPWAGYCQEADGSENSMYSYSLQECCELGLVGEYDSCIKNTLNQSGPEPTKHPTRSPITSSLPGVYYPDFAAGFCRSDGLHGDKPYVFASAEKCCRNAVMNYDDCVWESINRFQEAPPTTPEPTHKPTQRPTSKPSSKPTNKPTPLPTQLQVSPVGNYYPDFAAGYCKSDGLHVGKPYVFTTAEKCCTNEVMDYYSCLIVSIERFQEAPPVTSTTTTTTTTTTTSLAPTIYYPDILLKVCKSDGNHGDSPYTYSDAPSCCDSFSIDYERCMAYNAGYEYIPIPWEGYCRVSSGTELVAYKYDSPEDCCQSTQSSTYSSCLLLSLENLGGTSSVVSSSTTTTTSTSASSKVYYPDLVLKVCKSDGKQGTIPYLFNTAHACCDNNYMNYDICMSYAQGNTGVIQTSTTTTTTTTQASKIYYPDLVLKVCKSDGKQGQIPFLFSSAHECCDNNLMDYDSCMAFANGDTTSGNNPPPVTPQPSPKPTTGATPAPITPQPSPKPTMRATLPPMTSKPTIKPTPKPTEKYTTPPVVVSAIDGRKIIGEVTDSFEKGLTGVFPWSTSPDNPWTIDTTSFKDGSASARSAPISKGETSDLYVAVNTDHGGMFYFSLKTDVQMPFSGFYVNVDDKSKMGYTFAFSEYRDLSVSVDAGQHVLMFRTWVPSNSPGPSTTSSGTVNVDKVSFQPILVEDFESQQLSWGAEFVGPDWQFDTSNPHAGSISLRNPSISSGQSSSMSFEVTTSSKGAVVEFWYDSNLSGGDKFEFVIDGYAVFTVTTDSDNWKMQSKSLVPGKHTIEWKFIKSSGVNSSIWIDDIRIRPIGA